MNAEIIYNRGNGLLASSSDDWFHALYKIYLDHGIRKVMGNNGRQLIEKYFTIQSRLSDSEEFISRTIQPVETIPFYRVFEKSETYDITVIIPYHNEEQTLDKTVTIISQQTNLPKEVIFVNSSSTDGGSAFLNKWIEQHQGENGVHYRNIFEYTDTPSSSKNVGIRLAKTKRVAFMDCGLLFSKNLLESQICYINNSGLDIVSGVCDFIGASVFDNCCLAHTYGYQRKRVVVPSTLVRKSIFKQTGLFLENRRAGYDYAWKIYLKKAALLRGVNLDAVIRYNGVNFADSFISLFKKMILYSKSSTAIRHYYMPYIFAVIVSSLGISTFFNFMFIIWFVLI
jgi:glycosyltransferase involved in cell wall biosynthesis